MAAASVLSGLSGCACYLCCRSGVVFLVRPDIDDSVSRETFNKLDMYTKFLMKPAADGILRDKENPYAHTDIKTEDIDLGWKKVGAGFLDWKKKRVKVKKYRISKFLSVDIVSEDDIHGKMKMFVSLSQRILRFRCLFPLNDKPNLKFESNFDAQQMLEDLRITMGEGGIFPDSYNSWDEMTSDESLTRIFFYGMGAILTATQPDQASSGLGAFVVEMPLENFETRPGFRPLGATIYFDADQKPCVIFDPHQNNFFYPDKAGWEAAKFLVRVSVVTLITVREHLVWSHLIISNSVTKASIIHLPPCHPIRRLLTIFTFFTNKVNTVALKALTPRNGLLHRATGFTYNSMKEIFDASYQASNIFEPFGDRKVSSSIQKLSDEGKFPYLSEGIAYFQIIRAFVQQWLNIADMGVDDAVAAKSFYDAVKEESKGQKYELPNLEDDGDAMINLLSQMIFVVTAYHELAGGVVDYFCLPSRCGFRCTNNAAQMDVQSFLITTIITGSTSVRTPNLMQDFNNFFGAGEAPSWETAVWNSFKRNIQIQSKKVIQADANRQIKFKAFDPARFECSISV